MLNPVPCRGRCGCEGRGGCGSGVRRRAEELWEEARVEEAAALETVGGLKDCGGGRRYEV